VNDAAIPLIKQKLHALQASLFWLECFCFLNLNLKRLFNKFVLNLLKRRNADWRNDFINITQIFLFSGVWFISDWGTFLKRISSNNSNRLPSLVFQHRDLPGAD